MRGGKNNALLFSITLNEEEGKKGGDRCRLRLSSGRNHLGEGKAVLEKGDFVFGREGGEERKGK